MKKKLRKKVVYKKAAWVTVLNAAKMTLKGRRKIAEWLIQEGIKLRRDGSKYSGRFTARYWYKE